MITEDQTEVVEFLGSPSTHAGAEVERIETHASIVFLAGTRALKLKRAVHYDYVDFSTAGRRRAMCEAEVRINRRTAPGLYRGVVAVTREPDGSLALGGPSAPIDWVIDMRTAAARPVSGARKNLGLKFRPSSDAGADGGEHGNQGGANTGWTISA